MKNTCLFAQLVFVLCLLCAGLLFAEPADVLSTLDKNHPRLMLKDEDLQHLKEQYDTDRTLQKCVQDTLAEADSYINARMLTYDKIGPRLLHVSRNCLHRIYALALAARWTGDEKYARKAVENLLTVCAFKDWNPSHFLDTAEMSHAVGIGYDWLYSYLDGESRQRIKAALVKNGLEPGLSAYKKTWWAQSEFNWNQVCNGGMIIGALAIAETDPNYAEQIIPAAVRSLPLALKSYGPDGAWGEGPGYWSYATHYTAYGLAALQSALGKDFGLSQIKGLAESGSFPIHTTGPTGLFLNFADCGERSSARPMPCMFWPARVYDNPLYAESEHEMIAKSGASPQHIVWYVPAPRKRPPAKDLDRYFRGPVEVAVFRSAWDDPDALFVGVKAGYNQVNHGHLDLGNFELDALGVRWARDLGSDNYNLPGYWNGGRGGQRWSYYRLNSASHNVPMLAGENQDPQAVSRFTVVETNKKMPFVLVDLTSAYEKHAKKVTRGVATVENRRAVLVLDEFELKEPCEVAWGMTTDAKIDISQKGKAVLTLKGRELIARVLSPADAEFVVESAEQKPPQESNKGVSRLLVRLAGAKGDVRIAVLLCPVWKDGKGIGQVEIKPLEEWTPQPIKSQAPRIENEGSSGSRMIDHSRLLLYRDADGNEHPVKTTADWVKRRQQILDGMQAAMGPLPDRKELLSFDTKLLESVKTGEFERRKISMIVERDDRLHAYLLIPSGLKKGQKVAAMLALHPTHPMGKGDTAGLSGRANLSYGLELAKRGYVVIVPDYPSFGDYKDYDFSADHYVSGTMKGIFNHMRCVDYLCSLEMVDPQRLGVIGHSLGGHNSMFVGVFDTRLKVIVSSCGWTPFHDYYGGNITGWTSDCYMPRLRDVYNLDPDHIPFDFYEVVAGLAPRAFFSNSPLHDDNFDVNGVKKAMPVAAEVYRLFGAVDKLQVCYPDAGHDFPPEVREQAYRFIDRELLTQAKAF